MRLVNVDGIELTSREITLQYMKVIRIYYKYDPKGHVVLHDRLVTHTHDWLVSVAPKG